MGFAGFSIKPDFFYMREIKFRVWYQEGKRFLQPSEIKVLSSSAGLFNIINGFSSQIKQENFINYIIEQFTGLKDKKGCEIYEGDIVHHETYGTGEVKYVDGDGWFVAVGKTDEWYNTFEEAQNRLPWNGKVEIIGNIHESWVSPPAQSL